MLPVDVLHAGGMVDEVARYYREQRAQDDACKGGLIQGGRLMSAESGGAGRTNTWPDIRRCPSQRNNSSEMA